MLVSLREIFCHNFNVSLKAETRKKRGTGARRKVTGNGRPPKSWNTFLRCDENKTEHFGFLANKIVTVDTDITIVVTKDENVVSNKSTSWHHVTTRRPIHVCSCTPNMQQ